ncbi:RagB/SusD family nutrient uptake outer membrane protein [Prolixibacteraceae bacterium JC049]|nr:RagB/SusD family nutrient uptake outer membrane protein [Prolixibacteraceae bacterium JC049]
MKINMKYIIVLLFTIMIGQSCSEDFLDRSPLDAASDETFFTKTSDLKNYSNGLYSIVIRGIGGNRWTQLDKGTDDLVTSSPRGSLMRRSVSGQAPESSASWKNGYRNIRKTNYFLANASKVPVSDKSNHYIGEVLFIRAWAYFNLLKEFGGVPYITDPLETNSEELYRPRDSRDFIAQKILEDLDQAIEFLHWKGKGEASESGRINKETALTFKSRVALYEGTWEKYHGSKGTLFAVEGKDGNNFLQEAIEAGEQLIAYQGNKIYKGRAGWEYNGLWDQLDYRNIAGAFLYKNYSVDHSVMNNWSTYSVGGWDASITKQCIDQYLAKDGKPEEITTVEFDRYSMVSLAENKDPRLAQSVWNPANGTLRSMFPGPYNGHAYNTSMPGLITNQQRWPAITGYRIWKGTLAVPVAGSQGEYDDLIIRYGEALLNYAEAKAILGTITQSDIDKSINVLRERAGMVPMNLTEVNSWNIDYSSRYGYEPTASNIVNEIRRERRVELLMEGFRTDDIKRWALIDAVYNGMKPKGAGLGQFLDYWNNADNLVREGFIWSTPEAVKLTKGVNCDEFEDGFINPFFRLSDFKADGNGYYVNPERDYLNAVPQQEIFIYESKGGVTLEQNPGWF